MGINNPGFGPAENAAPAKSKNTPDVSGVIGAASKVLSAIEGTAGIAAKIEEAVSAAVAAIAGAQTSATTAIEGEKNAAIAAIKRTKPAPTNSAQEESENTPVDKNNPFG